MGHDACPVSQSAIRPWRGILRLLCLPMLAGALMLAGCPENGNTPPPPPVGVSDTVTIAEDTVAQNINVLANDIIDDANDELTVAVGAPPANGTAVRNADNTITYTPNANFNGIDTFIYTVNNGEGGSTFALVTITVTPVIDTLPTPTRSTSVALTTNDRALVVVNRETNSVAIVEVQDAAGNDVANVLAEVAVGQEPRYVALSPDDLVAYVVNAVSGTVSVIALQGPNAFSVIAEIPVGIDLRGAALTPNGTRLYVANHTAGTVSIIDTATRQISGTVNVGGNPMAIAITNDGDADDTDETVFVTQFFAALIPEGPGEGFDDGKQGIVRSFSVATPDTVTTTTLTPLAASGFTADRSAFCPQSTTVTLHNPIFCPDVEAAPNSETITRDPQGVFPNQLYGALIRNGRLYIPNIGAAPEPPVRFNVNVQALVYVVDTATADEMPDLHVNLNQQVAQETQPDNPTASLQRLFGNDLVDIDANAAGSSFLIVSRGGNYVFRATLTEEGQLSLGAPNVVRFQTGNIPNGVVISRDGTRAYTNNEVGVSATAINLTNNTVIRRDIPTGTPPEPGTFAHQVLVGKLAFFTALGIPDNGIFDAPIRAFVPLTSRGKQSDNAWSSCGSCHPDGLSDNVTWIFATGPRQTVPLDAFFAKDNPGDQRISNWSAVMGSITDFNQNSRGVQGGCGFASDNFAEACAGPTTAANPEIYNHGITQGASDALDAQTVWVQTVRSPLMPAGNIDAIRAGRVLFRTNCASCHGGQKWTKSQVIYADNPAFDANPLPPAGVAPGTPRDPGVRNAGPQIVSYTVGEDTLNLLEPVGTFDATDPLEIRGTTAVAGASAQGALGFNVPSLLGVRYHAPYFHHGAAQTLEEVFAVHRLAEGTIAALVPVGSAARTNLLAFLNSIDTRTDSVRSETDNFRDGIARIVIPVTLSGDEEVADPSVETEATGTATVTINAAQTQINFTVTVTGIADTTDAHIHIGAAGTNGPVVLFFCSDDPPDGIPTPAPCPGAGGGTISGTLTEANLIPREAVGVLSFADAIDAILAGNAYINVHSVAFPAGEVRGQLAVPDNTQ